MEKKTIAIIFGGMSAEYGVSLQSAHAVITQIDLERFVPLLVGITKEGHWFRFRGDAQAIVEDTWHNSAFCTKAYISSCRGYAGLVEYGTGATTITRLDAAFPIMHGPCGEDGTIQGLLDLAGISIVGCGVFSSAVCMDKDNAHRLVAQDGVDVPKSKTFTQSAAPREICHAAEELGYPVFVKPLRAGSSFGISKVTAPDGLAAAAELAFRYDSQILVEEAIDGFEVGCAVMGDDDLRMGELDEVELAEGFFDYTEKYNLVTSHIHVPARIGQEKAKEVKRAAAKIYKRLRCSGFARIDFFLTPAGRIVFNEVNTIPGFTQHSRFPSMMQAAGMDFHTVVNQLIAKAVAT